MFPDWESTAIGVATGENVPDPQGPLPLKLFCWGNLYPVAVS